MLGSEARTGDETVRWYFVSSKCKSNFVFTVETQDKLIV